MDFSSILTWLFSGATVLTICGKVVRWLFRSWRGDVEILAKKVEASDEMHEALSGALGDEISRNFSDVVFRLRYPSRLKLVRRLFQIQERFEDPQSNGRLYLGSFVLLVAAFLARDSAEPLVGLFVGLGGVVIEVPYFIELVLRDRARLRKAQQVAAKSLERTESTLAGSGDMRQAMPGAIDLAQSERSAAPSASQTRASSSALRPQKTT